MAKELIYKVRIDFDDANVVSGLKNIGKGSAKIESAQERTQRSIKDTVREIQTEIAQLELLEQTGKESYEQIAEQAERLNATLATAPEKTKGVISAQKRLASLQNRLAVNTGDATKGTINFQKATSNANQTLFTFGDTINDAQQFQFGFAQGARAIGNNIAFAAEQISNTATRAGGLRGAFKALGSSLFGVGGIILGINLAITAITVFGDKLFSSKNELGEFNKELKTTSDFLDDIVSKSVDDFVEQAEGAERQIDAINDALQSFFEEQGGNISNLPVQMKQFSTAAADASNVIDSQLNAQLNLTNKALSDQELLEAQVSVEAQKVLINKRAELEAQLAINRALRDNLDASRKAPQAPEIPDIQTEAPVDFVFDEDPLTEIPQSAIDKEIQAFNERIANFKSFQDQKTQIAKIAEAQRQEIFVNAIGAAGDLIGQAFGQSKELAIAQTLVSTYAAAQKAYESQLAIPTPDAPARAAAAAAVAVAQGLARLAAIRKTELQSGGSGGGASGGSEGGFSGARGAFANGQRQITPPGRPDLLNRRNNQNINVIVKADKKGFSAWVEDGKRQRKSGSFTLRSDV